MTITVKANEKIKYWISSIHGDYLNVFYNMLKQWHVILVKFFSKLSYSLKLFQMESGFVWIVFYHNDDNYNYLFLHKKSEMASEKKRILRQIVHWINMISFECVRFVSKQIHKSIRILTVPWNVLTKTAKPSKWNTNGIEMPYRIQTNHK